MKKVYLSFMFMFLCCAAFAQHKLTGIVIEDPSGETVIGATIQVKGKSTGTITDLDGKFSITVSPGDVLIISYLGLDTQNITVKSGEDNITVKMPKSSVNLDEVVVVGYGVTRKRDLAESISSLKTSDIKAEIGRAHV